MLVSCSRSNPCPEFYTCADSGYQSICCPKTVLNATMDFRWHSFLICRNLIAKIQKMLCETRDELWMRSILHAWTIHAILLQTYDFQRKNKPTKFTNIQLTSKRISFVQRKPQSVWVTVLRLASSIPSSLNMLTESEVFLSTLFSAVSSLVHWVIVSIQSY